MYSISSFPNSYTGALGYTGLHSAPVNSQSVAGVTGVQMSFSIQMLLQACQSLGAGWGSFAGGAHQLGSSLGGGWGSIAGGGYQVGQNFGAGFAGYGLDQRFGIQNFQGYGQGYGNGFGYGANYFAPQYPQGANWGSASLYGQLGVQFGYQQVPGETRQMWDVWFDSKDGQKTVQRSPIVLDLNNNGKADITGKNILGDGKIDGPTTLFDLDPDNISYEFKSEQRRPGSGAPNVDGGYWVNADGEKIKGGVPKGKQPKYNGFKYYDKNGQLVGEMKEGLYHYGKQEKREITEWLAKDGGDGFLVADLDGDGQINSAVELFGTEGTNGAKYKNGYEKLGALYDKNRDGVVTGDELKGLQVWVDSNADGKVQEGELQSLQQHNITSFNVGNYNAETMEGSYTVGGGIAPYLNISANVFGGYGYGGYSQPFYGYPNTGSNNSFAFPQPYGY